MSEFEDLGFIRRKFPRRSLAKKVGVLFGGQYFICHSGEIGEGGMSIVSEYALTEGRELVLSFQIPQGTFVTLRGVIRSTKPDQGVVTHGIAFDSIPLGFKRQIRTFVSARISSLRI
ncbi:MAG: PilZ domain-containing protein [Pseudobdellovibrionaceae bacterium]